MNSFSLRLTFSLFLTLLGSLINHHTAIAQIIPDHSLGAESSQIRPDTIKNTPSDVIEGGATRDSNLFHSFREFNVNEGRGAYFANPDVIQNIFSRVTGGNISQILGTLGVLGNANLFLINPSGIIFGPNARLDMRGAFIGATADSLVFDNNFEFSATNPNAPPLLTVNIPLGLRFRETPANISSTANLATPSHLTLKAGNLNIGGTLLSGGDLTLEALNTLTIRDSVISPFIAASGGNLLLQGNQGIDIYALNHPDSGIVSGKNLVLRSTNAVSGDAHYWSGGSFRIEKLDGTLGGLVSLYDPIIRTVGDVFIDAYEGTSLHIIAGGKVEIPSYILITGADAQFGLQETITLSNGQQITIDGKNNPTVDIRAGVSPEFIGTPFVVESGLDFFDDPTDFSATSTSADINVGTIFIGIDSQDIIMGDVLLTNQYQPNPNLQGSIAARSSQENFAAIKTGLVGDGGRVTIDSKGNINITGDINSTSLNTGGNILLNSVGNTLIKNSKVDVNGIISVTGKQGGNIQINANNITLTNMTLPALNGGNVLLNSLGDTIINKSTIGVTGSQGGNIQINSNNITLTTTVLLAGIGQGLGSENTLGGDITLNAIQDIILDSSIIANYLQPQGLGNLGNVIINTSNLIFKGSEITSNTYGKGDAGAIQITATKNIILTTNDSFSPSPSGIFNQVAITQQGVSGEGDSRGIVINTSALTLENGATIDSSTFGLGNAGVIQINATDGIKIIGGTSQSDVVSQSGITSQVVQSGIGNSGGIVINTSNLTLQDGGRIDASTLGEGNAGAISINANDSIKLIGESSVGQISKISSQVQVGIDGEGNSGGINLNTSTLTLDKGGGIYASTLGKGDAGAITITATDSINITGESSQIGEKVVSGIFSQINQDGEDIGTGDSGGIIIDTSTLTIQNGGSISASTYSLGNAGDISINATDNITISGESLNGLSSNISSQVGSNKVGEIIADGNSGRVEINTRTLSLIDGGQVTANTFGKGDAGAIKITASNSIYAVGQNNEGIVSGISSIIDENAEANAGGIEIITGTLSLTDGAYVNASTRGIGNAGGIKITASNSISASGEDSKGRVSGIFSAVDKTATGKSEGIEISTGTLSLTDGGSINASTLGIGNAGAIKITASNSIAASGENRQGDSSQSVSSGIYSAVRAKAEGDAGGIEITTSSLSLSDGGIINANTFGTGNAGAIKITATNSVSASGVNSQGDGSGIYSAVGNTAEGNSERIEITTSSLSLSDGAAVNSSTEGNGNAGNILIKEANLITASGGSQISTVTSSQGNAGSVIIAAPNAVISFDGVSILNGQPSGIFTVINPVDGLPEVRQGGEINIAAKSLTLANGAQINAQTSGLGNAGNVLINIEDTINLTNFSSIKSLVAAGAIGNSGNIDLKARSLTLTNGSQIETLLTRESSALNLPGGVGKAGNININTSDFVNISGVSKVQLPIEPRLFPTEGFSSGLFASSERGALGDGGTITLTTNALYLADGAVINTLSANSGTAGNITINANTFSSTDGGQVITITKSSGNAGTISLNITDNILLSGSDPTFADRLARFGEDIVNNQGAESGLFAQTQDQGIAGNIIINTPIFNIADSAVVSARTSGSGKGGTISVNSPTSITLGEKSQLNVETSGAGQAGNIEITSNTVTIGKDAQISATATRDASNTSGGGSININASNLNIAGKLGIFAETQGQSPAGTLTLNPNNANPNLSILFIEQGLISASTSASGNGGDINISAPNNIDISGIGTIAVETSGSGNAGTINLNTNQLNLTSGVTVTASTSKTGTGNAGNINLNATQINLEQATVTAFTEGGGNAGSINVPNAQTIALNNSTISTEIQKDGIATERSNINLTSNTLELDNSNITASTSGVGNAGDITLTNQQLNLNNSQISATSTGNGNAGSISLPQTQNLSLNQSQISVSTTNKGSAGSISVPNAQNINLNQSRITASTSGVGDTGTIELTGTEQIALTNNSEISNAVLENGIGNALTITLNTPNLSLQNSSISSNTDGTGNAGSITVPKAQTITLDNSTISTEIQKNGVTTEASNITIQTQQLTLDNNSQITATTSGDGDAGTITITADSLRLTNRSSIQTNTASSGVAGDLVFNLSDDLTLNNSTLEASTSPNSTGNGGSIRIDPRTVNLDNNALISVNSQGTGDGGNLSLEATNLNLRNNSEISATTASGEGGNLTLNVTDTVTQRNHSPISATAGGTGNGGNITLNTRFLVGNENSNITANAFQGRGGNINITADGIFRGSNSPITASSQLGVDGVVQTNTPEVDPSRGLLNLPQNPVDPNTLIAQNACRRGGQSEFTVTGRGGLPNTPEQVQRSNEVEVGLVDATQQTARSKPKKETLATRKIIPAQGWQRNDKGEMVLVATPTTENTHRQTTMTDTCTSN